MALELAGSSVLAVVPARGGSVGIPRKNLAKVGGLSLIARAAEVVSQLPWITQAVISTDDAEMREEGCRHGLDAPFMRPRELGEGRVSGSQVLLHAWQASEAHYGTRFEYALYLEPTSPLRRPEDVERTLESLLSGRYGSAVTVSPSPGHFTPQKCLLVDDQGLLRFFHAAGESIHARQEIPPCYFRNGVAYAVRRDSLFESGSIIGGDTLAVVIDRPLVNIDEPFELELAEWLLAREGRNGE